MNIGHVSLHIEATPKELLAIARALNGDHQAPPVRGPAADKFLDAIRFVALNNEETLDSATGLIWTRDNVPGSQMNWKDAAEACAKLTLGGHSDWRLPTIKELLSIVDYDRHEPAINTDVFRCSSSYYWSSTPLHSSPGGCAWVVGFNAGGAYWGLQDDDDFVRAVRASQSLDLWHVR